MKVSEQESVGWDKVGDGIGAIAPKKLRTDEWMEKAQDFFFTLVPSYPVHGFSPNFAHGTASSTLSSPLPGLPILVGIGNMNYVGRSCKLFSSWVIITTAHVLLRSHDCGFRS